MPILTCPIKSCHYRAIMEIEDNAKYVMNQHLEGEHPRYGKRKLQAHFCAYCGKAIGAKDRYYGKYVCIECLGEIA